MKGNMKDIYLNRIGNRNDVMQLTLLFNAQSNGRVSCVCKMRNYINFSRSIAVTCLESDGELYTRCIWLPLGLYSRLGIDAIHSFFNIKFFIHSFRMWIIVNHIATIT
jgi:hypothetical protein